MELLGDVGQTKSHFGLFGDSVNLHTTYVLGLCWMCNWFKNHFDPLELLGDVVQVEAYFGLLGEVLNLGTK
jgi:hypothetical protein